jgi:hypothetical protein
VVIARPIHRRGYVGNAGKKLAKIERADAETRWHFIQTMKADTSMYVSHFIIFGALKRTLALLAGFRGHVRDRNFTCAAALTLGLVPSSL